MIKTTLYNAKEIAAGTGGILTPVELVLNGDTKKVAIEMSVVTTRAAIAVDGRRDFTLCWASTPENLDPSSDDVPVLLMECTHRKEVTLSKTQTKQKIQVLERCLAGQYMYVWVEYPYSQEAYAVTVDATEYAYGSGGGSSTSPSFTTSVGFSSSATKTRPNDTKLYAANDVIAESTSVPTVWTFANIAPSAGGDIVITAVEFEVDTSAVPAGMTQFRLHLYSTSPTAIADNAAFNLPSGDRAKYLGFVEIPTPRDLGDTLYVGTEEGYYWIRKQVRAASGTLYGILETVGSYQPTASVVKKITLRSVQVG